jgi:hypothetical protein
MFSLPLSQVREVHIRPTVDGQSGASWQGLVPVMPKQTLYVEVGSNGKADGGPTFAGGGAAGSPDPEGA